MLELVSCPIDLCQRVTFDESPTISLWPSGSLRAESRISTSFPIKLSVIFFPQSMRRADARGPAEAQWADPLLINLLSAYMQILFKILPSISMQ
jgi:hypothetical protein